MKKENIIFWASTGLLSLAMSFSAFQYFTNPEMAAGFSHLGFPSYFRIELGIAKILGVIALLSPIPKNVKEWAYAGFTINFISAIIAHIASGDGVGTAVSPFIMLVLLATSYIFMHRKNALQA